MLRIQEDLYRSRGDNKLEELTREARRLRILVRNGESEAALPIISELRERMQSMLDSGGPDRLPWMLRESILNTGTAAAMHTKQWQLMLAFNKETLASMEARAAHPLDVARMRLNDAGVLRRLGRFNEAKRLLDECRTVIEREHDVRAMGLVFNGLAGIESELGHYQQALAFGETALRLRYLIGDPGECAMSHHNYSNHAELACEPLPKVLAHRIAAALIRLQIADARQDTTLWNLVQLQRKHAPERLPIPDSYESLSDQVEQLEGVRFRELFDRLPRRAASGADALTEIIRLIEKQAQELGGADAQQSSP